MTIFSEEEIEEQIEAWREQLSRIGNMSLEQQLVGYDVYKVDDWPSTGLTTFVTVGLSGFLLSDEAGNVAGQELRATFPLGLRAAASRLIDSVADQILDRRHPNERNETFAIGHVQDSLQAEMRKTSVSCAPDKSLDSIATQSELYFPILISRIVLSEED